MISKERKCIFIHIHKTGGTSIEKKLGFFDVLERDVQDHRTLREIELLTRRRHFFRKSLYALKIGKPTVSLQNFKTALFPELTKTQYNEFYKFSFVRNTWSRMYSWYANVMRDPLHRKAYKIDDENYSLLSFLQEKINYEKFSQLHFLKDKNEKINLDFIGRFENLQLDFDKIADHLCIVDSELSKQLMTNYDHYTEFYDEATKDLVYKHYKDEIDYFGFEYGEGTSTGFS
jgi:Sulfotransferase family